jgi:hypothetical protein
MDDEIFWLVTQYCCYVYEQKKLQAHNYVIDVDKLRKHLMGLFDKNQRSQRKLQVGGVQDFVLLNLEFSDIAAVSFERTKTKY